MYCDYCGAENPDDATTCFACHRTLDMPDIQATDNPVVADNSSSSSTTGDLLKERYRIVECIGQGGFGSVYKALDTYNNDQLVAVKEIDMGGLKPQEIIEATDAFNREVHLLSELKHPNLPRMHTHFTDASHWYLVMDFISGNTLERYLEEIQSKGTAHGVKLADVLSIGMQLCTVLHYMHMHNPAIIFRDLKPSNVMLAPGQRVYLIDFGIARVFKPGQVKDTMALGSPGYAAPEQYGKAQTTPRADIYSLGAILHQMLTGKDPADTPFHFAPVRFTHPTLPVEIEQLIMQMLELEADKRPTSMALVKQRLGAITDRKSISTSYAGGYAGLNTTYNGYNSGPGTHPVYTAAGTQSPSTSQRSQQQGHGQWQSMQPPHSAPARQKKPRVSRRAAVGIVGGIIVATMICGNLGRKNSSQDVQDSNSQDVATPTDDAALSLTNHIQYSLHTAAITALTCAPDGTAVASASADKTVQVWNPNYQDRRFFSITPTYQQAATAVAWSPDGKNIASGSLDRTLCIWNVKKGATTLKASYPAAVTALAWSSDNTRLAVGCSNGMVYICDANTLHTKFTYKEHNDSIHALACGDIYMASASADSTVKIWNSKDGNTIYTYLGHSNTVNAVAWAPDLLQIASASNDRTVQVWNPLNGQISLTYTGHITNGTPTPDVDFSKNPPGQVYALAWEPQTGKHIVSGDSNGMMHVWRSDDGSITNTYNASNKSIRSLIWVSDNTGSYIANGGDNRLVQTWSID